MTMLDEIEARDKDTDEWLLKNDGWSHPEGPMATMHNDRKFLIRAVRQFWELAEARRGERAFAKLDVYNKENWKKASDRLSAAVRLDPDVLKLVEAK